jgi:hypothetical protein
MLLPNRTDVHVLASNVDFRMVVDNKIGTTPENTAFDNFSSPNHLEKFNN